MTVKAMEKQVAQMKRAMRRARTGSADIWKKTAGTITKARGQKLLEQLEKRRREWA